MNKSDYSWMGSKDPFVRREKIESLDPNTDYREITKLFYADFQSIMMLQSVQSFLMNFSSPRMSRILGSTGELTRRFEKRFLDTALLAGSVMEHGFEPGPGRDAARRVNAMHRQYDIHPDDFIMTGCDEVVAALTVSGRFGWREVSDKERQSVRNYYSDQTRAFGSREPLPPTADECFAFWHQYLDEQLAFEPQNKEMADQLLRFFQKRMPSYLKPLIKPMLLAQVDDRVVRACGYATPAVPLRWLSKAFFGQLSRRDPVPDQLSSDFLGQMAEKVYPDGWKISDVGTHLGAEVANK